MTTKSLEEFAAALDAHLSAVRSEKDLVHQEERHLTEFGRLRSRNTALQHSLRAVGGQWGSDALLDNIVEAVSERQRELETSRLQCEVFARALDDLRTRRARAAEQVALTIATLRKQARELLEARYGKQRLFSRWSDELAGAYEWRRSMLGQLLALVSSDPERGCALLECFFADKTSFTLSVRRGFWIAAESGLREIRPTADGEVYAVPKDLPLREGFECVLAGRAQLAAVTN